MKIDIKCKGCGIEFEPFKRNGIILSRLCASCLIKKANKQKEKEWNKGKKIIKERLKTHSDWLNDLQKLVNKFVRLRDKNKPCISCETPLINKYDAGHYYSVGSNPYLRFNLDNIHGQCVHCNRDLHGNLIEYGENLPKRIGKEAFEKLKSDSNISNKMTIFEIKEQIKLYKEKIKELT